MISTEEPTATVVTTGHAIYEEPRSDGRHRLLKDFALGFALMWDRRISVVDKFATLGLAVGITALMIAVEIPFEALIVVVLSKAGFIGVMALDAVEAVAGPVFFTCLLLTHSPAAIRR